MGKVTVIVVNGVSRSGKDTFIDYLAKKTQLLLRHSTIQRVFTALINSSMIVNGKKGKKEREFLASVKQAWITYSNGPLQEVTNKVDHLEEQYKFMQHIGNIFLTVQVREITEITKLKDHFKEDLVSLLVVRDSVDPQHVTDEYVEDWDYDFVVSNNGSLEQLESQVDGFLTFLNRRD
jgi:hypothetical protein